MTPQEKSRPEGRPFSRDRGESLSGLHAVMETWRVQIDGDITCTEAEVTRTVLRIRLMLKQAGIPKTESLTVKSWLVEQLAKRPDPMRIPGHESEHVKR